MQKSITMESMFLMVLVQALGRERRFVKEVIKKALYRLFLNMWNVLTQLLGRSDIRMANSVICGRGI